ncbi:hypothetical protein FB446DRAFT_710534 [Lentinula raphanica]|nr:hypothetical protein FB446DRAFT_710534 [Lentinula raphanica]
MSILRVLSSRFASSTAFSSFALAEPLRHRLSTVVDRKAENSAWESVDKATKQVSERIYASSQQLVKSPAQIWADHSKTVKANLAEVASINNNPYAGRSVKIVDGDLADGFRRLDTILARNKVRKQLKLAERHEKKGPKRRRLESERWRRLFAQEVRKNVQLVTKIRRRGA